MKKFFVVLIVSLICNACNLKNTQTKAIQPNLAGSKRTATFAAGCFWGIQEGFLQLKGVDNATSGYAGGHKVNPTYEEVSAERTGHAEAVQVVYDPKIITYEDLLKVFFLLHDPTQLNRQGPDVGASYRSIAFYENDEEKNAIQQAIENYNNSGYSFNPVVTEVKAFEKFYTAEEYHQNYYRTNPTNPYIQNVCGPKVQKLQDTYPELLKPEFKAVK